MNHKFKYITTPQIIQNILDRKYNLEKCSFRCRKCVVCDFIVATHTNEFDIFYYSNKEIYEEYLWYDTLTEKVNISCAEFIIKKIIE